MAVTVENGHLVVKRSGTKLWGTDAPPVNRIDSGQLSIAVTINFPDFAKDVVYGFNMFEDDIIGQTFMYGMSLAKMLPAETQLANQDLGAWPSGANAVDVRAILNWTNTPTNVRGSPVLSPVRQGKETHLPGGSAVLEICAAYRRMIHVDISTGRILLQAKQSARDFTESVNWAAGNQVFNINGGPRIGWTYGTQQSGIFVEKLDEAGPTGNNAWRGGSSGASLTDWTDHASTWSGTLILTPLRRNAGV